MPDTFTGAELPHYKKGENMRYTTEEIAEILCKMTYDDCNQFDERYKEVEEFIYELKINAENKYNRDCFRIFWQLLQDFANVHEDMLKF